MGHDEHFLSRLDRVNRPTVEFALALYRDPELVRALLGSNTVPEGAERVALSLGDTERGPFVVVARDGHFVTCLGEGMWPRGLPVLPRSHLDELTQRLGAARTAKAQAQRQVGRHGALGQLIARFYRGGEFLSREEALALRFWAPALFHDLWEIMLSFAGSVNLAREGIAAERDPGAGRHAERLQAFFHGTWAFQHLLTVLVDCDNARDCFDRIAALESAQGGTLLATFTWELLSMGTVGSTLRGAWVSARLGRFALGAQKAWVRNEPGFWPTVSAAYGLTAVGSRQSRSRAEVLKFADGLAALPPVDETERARAAIGRYMGSVLREPEASRRWAVTVARNHLFHHSRKFDARVGWVARTPEEIPDDLLVASLLDNTTGVFPSGKRAADHLHAVPMVASAPLASLYLPHAVQAQFERSWSTERALAWVRPWQEFLRQRVGPPVRRGESVGRNDPCRCNSGRKFKRCCGA